MKCSARIVLVLAAASFVDATATATSTSHESQEYGEAAAATTSSSSQHQRQRLLKAKPSFPTTKWHTARSDCTIQLISYLQIPSAPELAEHEEFVCELDASDTPGGKYTGLTLALGLTEEQKQVFKSMWKDGKLTPGTSKLKISEISMGVADTSSSSSSSSSPALPSITSGVLFDSEIMQIPPEVNITEMVNWTGGGSSGQQKDTTITSSVTSTNVADSGGSSVFKNATSPDNSYDDGLLFHRNLQSFGNHVGMKPMLVVKVTDKNGLAPDETTSIISSDVFSDAVNLKTQLHACSMGRVTVIPGDNNSGKINQSVYSAPGVVDVMLSISIETNLRSTIRNAITTAVQQKLGVTLPGPYKHVMYVIQKCYEYDTQVCDLPAYAFTNHWLSIYFEDYYKYSAVQVHELGHNFGLGHSGESGKEYNDHTCSMGNPLYADDIGKMCYNAAKSWQIGWYNDRKVTLNPKTQLATNANWGTIVTLVGIADYNNIAGIPVLLKLETDTVDDYYISFNRAIGLNADNVEADDELIINMAGKDGLSTSSSDLLATLLAGEQYVISNFGGSGTSCRVKLLSIDKSTSVWKVDVQVGSSTLSPTAQPTSFPTTKTPTNPPTTPLSTTKSPTPNPSTKKPTFLPTKPTTTKTKRRHILSLDKVLDKDMASDDSI